MFDRTLNFIFCNLQAKYCQIGGKNGGKYSENAIYYILNREIQEFLVKIEVLFLRILELFISPREINLCRLDTFTIMVENKSSMYNWVPAFMTSLDSTLQLQLYTSLKQTRAALLRL